MSIDDKINTFWIKMYVFVSLKINLNWVYLRKRTKNCCKFYNVLLVKLLIVNMLLKKCMKPIEQVSPEFEPVSSKH